MHSFAGTDDGVHWTGSNTFRTPNTIVWIDTYKKPYAGWAALELQFPFRLGENSRQIFSALLATWRTTIRRRFAARHCLRIGTAGRIPAALALGLGKNLIELIDEVQTIPLVRCVDRW